MDWNCPNCGAQNKGTDNFCSNCGARNPSREPEKKSHATLWVVIAALLAGTILGTFAYCSLTGKSVSELMGKASTTSTTVLESSTESNSTFSETTVPTVATTPATTTANGGGNTLFLPADSQYIEEHDVEIWSDDIEYDEYINMRYGPSKEEYDVIKKVQNGTMGRGLTGSINGWVLVNVDGTKGWVRDDLVIHYEDGVPDGIAKPVLYLYPEKKMNVSVKLSLKDAVFSCTYPDYGKGWNVTAYPNGKLINKADRREYSYLYWELDSDMKFDFSKGFIVKGKDTAAFLQKTLAQMGLKPKEYNEFIVYWLPRMQNNEYNLISFQTKTYTDNVKLKISPKPDSVLRVNMAYKPLTAKQAKNQKSSLKPQTFPMFERKGFTVVEWGGEEIK